MGSHEVKAKHSTDDMIPRITIRDAEDAGILKNALLVYAQYVQHGYTQKAVQPGADRFALTVEMNKEVESLMTLIRDIDAGTMGDTGPTTQKD